MTPLTVAVAIAATYSLTLLVVCDKITDRPRQWLLTRISGHGFARSGLGLDAGVSSEPVVGYECACGAVSLSLGDLLDHVHDARERIVQTVPQTKQAMVLYLLRCPWCASVYVGAPVMWSAWCFGTRAWWFIPAATFTARGVTGTWASLANPRK